MNFECCARRKLDTPPNISAIILCLETTQSPSFRSQLSHISLVPSRKCFCDFGEAESHSYCLKSSWSAIRLSFSCFCLLSAINLQLRDPSVLLRIKLQALTSPRPTTNLILRSTLSKTSILLIICPAPGSMTAQNRFLWPRETSTILAIIMIELIKVMDFCVH